MFDATQPREHKGREAPLEPSVRPPPLCTTGRPDTDAASAGQQPSSNWELAFKKVKITYGKKFMDIGINS